MFLACIMFVINKYLSNEFILALPISLVPFNQSCTAFSDVLKTCRAGYTLFDEAYFP